MVGAEEAAEGAVASHARRSMATISSSRARAVVVLVKISGPRCVHVHMHCKKQQQQQQHVQPLATQHIKLKQWCYYLHAHIIALPACTCALTCSWCRSARPHMSAADVCTHRVPHGMRMCATTTHAVCTCTMRVLGFSQLAQQKRDDALEAGLGWPLFTEGPDKLGWLMNFTTVRSTLLDSHQLLR